MKHVPTLHAMRRQAGITLMEIAFAVVMFALVVSSVLYGAHLVGLAKIRSFVAQVTHIKSATEIFKHQYGTMPGDFAQARERLRNCNSDTLCENGNGDQVVSRWNGTNCTMPNLDGGAQAFPCIGITNNETAQFWRHLTAAGLIQGVSMGQRYRWGDSFPKVRLTGGFQVLYNGNTTNVYVGGKPADGNIGNLSPANWPQALRGHFLIHMRDPTLFHQDFTAVGDGVVSSADAFVIDATMDDGNPNAGNLRSIGGGEWGCGNVDYNRPSNPTDGYMNMPLVQCQLIYKFD